MIRYLKPETWLTVRREAHQAVRLGANGCKTLQMVAGAGFDTDLMRIPRERGLTFAEEASGDSKCISPLVTGARAGGI